MKPRLAAACLAWAALGGCSPPSTPPPIVLISLDTLRADHLSAYGYERPTSPVLERFSAEAVRFDQAHAHATATLPSHLSLLTSLLPPEIGITRPEPPHQTQATTRLRLGERAVTLAEVLRQHGYRTAAFTGGGYLHPFYGFDQGFDHFETTRPPDGEHGKELRVSLRHLAAWLDQQESAGPAPLFVFLHSYDVHEPYSAPPPFERAFTELDYEGFRDTRGFEPRPLWLTRRLAELGEGDVELSVGLYDNGIRAADEALGELFELLRERGLYDRALIAVLSDHGEEFLDHGGFGHGPSVYQELARVPLLLRLPGGAHGGRVVPQPVGLIDVAPTLLDWVGVPRPEEFRGRSLGAVIRGEDDGAWLEARPVYVDIPDTGKDVFALRRGPWKLVRRGGRSELYHLGRDPTERRDLAGEEPARARELEDELTRGLEQMQARGTLAVPNPDPHPLEQQEALRALGYLE